MAIQINRGQYIYIYINIVHTMFEKNHEILRIII